jgi:hypothetical protein
MTALGLAAAAAAGGGAATALGPAAGTAAAAAETTDTGTTGTGTTGTSTAVTTTTTTSPTTTTTTATATEAPAPPVTAVPAQNPLATRALWIWELSASSHGSVSAIIARAHHYGVRTLIVKSGDGSSYWSQFSKTLVSRLHRAGIKVCAWQFVYGVHPATEAKVGAEAVARGANCLVIDAEGTYQGRYVAAQTYITALRKRVGTSYPVALASFPYIDYHSNFPYSVFLGPNGAQYNVPQMYWRDIGVSVTTVFAHTYEWNEIYRRPIYPLGQLYGSPPLTQLRQFDKLLQLYGAKGSSWWDWQLASNRELATLGKTTKMHDPSRAAVTLKRGASGDYVTWAQEYLSPWIAAHSDGAATLSINGKYKTAMVAAVSAFQLAEGLTVTGRINGPTWNQLLKLTPVTVKWVNGSKGKAEAKIVKR